MEAAMTSAEKALDLNAVAPRWWALVIRGLAAMLFGVLTFAAPGASLLLLVFFWGAYAIVDGVFNVVLAVRGARVLRGWGWLLFEGLVSIAAGAITFLWPGITGIVLLAVIAAWALVTGVAEVATAIRLRRLIRGEWLLALSGILSIAFGVLLLARPQAGAAAVAWIIGAYAILFGVLLVSLGMRVHRWVKFTEHPISTGGTPTHA
jgi:uncharacterized membrane protein HdeD (DUF308 family)